MFLFSSEFCTELSSKLYSSMRHYGRPRCVYKEGRLTSYFPPCAPFALLVLPLQSWCTLVLHCWMEVYNCAAAHLPLPSLSPSLSLLSLLTFRSSATPGSKKWKLPFVNSNEIQTSIFLQLHHESTALIFKLGLTMKSKPRL